MTILIVDDQITVLKGILIGVHFHELGIENVLTAISSNEAKEIISHHKIDILLSDVEMPGENGLQLMEWVQENYSDIIRIMLTSHADFFYAKESIKLGCFDYIVQPAPYAEIEQILSKAIAKYTLDQEREQYYKEGIFYSTHKSELSDRTVLNLFSHNPGNRQQSIKVLNQMDYPICADSIIQLIVIDIYPFEKSTDPAFWDLSIRKHILDSLSACGFCIPVYSLLTMNPYKQFVILLFCNDPTLECDHPLFERLYQEIISRICPEISCYIGAKSILPEIRNEIHLVDTYLKNNVTKKAGLYFTTESKHAERFLSIAENLSRWKHLIDSEEFVLLQESILSYIDFIADKNRPNLKTLGDLHQQLTQLFFIYAYQHSIDVTDLFTAEYSYNEYMDGFKNTKALRDSVLFIIPTIAAFSGQKSKKTDVQMAKDYILNNLSQNISVKDVADYVHLSPEYFTKLFKKETGQNIKNYILQVKVDIAKDLLANPSIPISMVALDLGYSNFSHFTQMFKRFENVTPTEYRKNLTGNTDT